MVKKVAIYTTPTCTYCQEAKEFFQSKNIQYDEFDVATDIEKRQEMIQKTGQLGVPVIAVGDRLMVGFDSNTLSDLLAVVA
jgi:glutaredoxin-like YruB-family protein